MSERFEVLMPNRLTFPRFTVNKLVANVSVTYPGVTPLDWRIYNAEGGHKFQKGDNFIIGTFGLVMPLSFQFDRNTTVLNPFLSFYLYGYGITSSHLYPFKEIGGEDKNSLMYGIMENYDTPCDLFIDIQNQALSGGTNIKDEAFNLVLALGHTDMKVSMVGVPAILDGTVQCITPYLKIYHNFALTLT